MAVAVALRWETGYWGSMDIMHDRAGYYICWGCLVPLRPFCACHFRPMCTLTHASHVKARAPSMLACYVRIRRQRLLRSAVLSGSPSRQCWSAAAGLWAVHHGCQKCRMPAPGMLLSFPVRFKPSLVVAPATAAHPSQLAASWLPPPPPPPRPRPPPPLPAKHHLQGLWPVPCRRHLHLFHGPVPPPRRCGCPACTPARDCSWRPTQCTWGRP